MASIVVTYYLKDPAKRPNPYQISPSVVFVDGVFTKVVDGAKLNSIDIFMSRYGAFRTPPVQEAEDGGSEVYTDGSDGDRQEHVSGKISAEGSVAEGEDNVGEAATDAQEGDKGPASDEGGVEGSEVAGLEAVRRRTKAEKDAGLDAAQAAEFRASGSEDPYEWFKETYPAEWSMANPDIA